jgi:hypothetical protein
MDVKMSTRKPHWLIAFMVLFLCSVTMKLVAEPALLSIQAVENPTSAGRGHYAWSIDFSYGYNNWGNKSNHHHVRLVRSGQ